MRVAELDAGRSETPDWSIRAGPFIPTRRREERLSSLLYALYGVSNSNSRPLLLDIATIRKMKCPAVDHVDTVSPCRSLTDQ